MKTVNPIDSDQEQSILLNNLHDLVFKFKLDGTLSYVNATWIQCLQYGENEIQQINMRDILAEGQTAPWNGVLKRLAAGQWAFPVEFTFKKKDGSEVIAAGSLHPVDGRPETVMGIFENVTSVRQAEKERDRLFLFSVDLLCITGYDGFLNRVNPAFQRTLGFPEEYFLNKPFIEFVHPEDRPRTFEAFSKMREGTPSVYFENRCLHKDGGYHWLSWTGHPVVSENLIYAIAHDVTAQRETEASLKKMAFTDDLTGLFNRRGFFIIAEGMLKIARRKRLGLMLMIADLDDMKQINDGWGHPEGDAALVKTAHILRERFRDSDAVARIGGDEFVAACLMDSAEQSEALCRNVESKMAEYNYQNPQPYRLVLSTGYAFAGPGVRTSLEELIASADQDMYAVKQYRRVSGAEK